MVRIPSLGQETLWHIESHQYYQKDNLHLVLHVLTIFESITYLPEYQKKQLCIMLLGSMLTPTSCNAMSNILNVLSEDMNEDWKNNNYPDQLPTEKNA